MKHKSCKYYEPILESTMFRCNRFNNKRYGEKTITTSECTENCIFFESKFSESEKLARRRHQRIMNLSADGSQTTIQAWSDVNNDNQ